MELLPYLAATSFGGFHPSRRWSLSLLDFYLQRLPSYFLYVAACPYINAHAPVIFTERVASLRAESSPSHVAAQNLAWLTSLASSAPFHPSLLYPLTSGLLEIGREVMRSFEELGNPIGLLSIRSSTHSIIFSPTPSARRRMAIRYQFSTTNIVTNLELISCLELLYSRTMPKLPQELLDALLDFPSL